MRVPAHFLASHNEYPDTEQNRLSEELWGHTYLSFRAQRGISSVRTRFRAEPVLREAIRYVKQLLKAPQKLRERQNLDTSIFTLTM